jgi:hypothetical protein
MKYLFFSILVSCTVVLFSAQKSTKSKTSIKNAIKPAQQKLPISVFMQLIDSTDRFVINDQTKFAHVDVPKSKQNQFLSYIKDSVCNEVPNLKSLVYYNFTLNNNTIFNGDIYWNDKTSYIVFTTNGRKYVNYFMKEGVLQLKAIFKL